MFPDVSGLGIADQELAELLLRRARVRVTPGSHFGARGAGHFRACFARDETGWAMALDRIVDVLHGMRS